MGRRGALGQPPTAWRERRREVIPWCTVHHSPPLETQRLRKLLFCWSFGYREEQKQNKTKDSPPGPPPGKGVVRSPSPDEQFPPSLGRPSQGHLPPKTVWRGPGRAGRPACDRLHDAARWKAAAAAWEWGRPEGGAHGDEQAEGLQPEWKQQRVSSGAWCVWSPQSASVLPKTAGHSVAEEAGLWHGSIQELYLLLLLHVSKTQPEMALLDHKRGHRTTQRLCGHLRRSEREVRRSTQLM